MRRLLPWLLLALARTARSAPSTLPRDDLLARAAAIDAFFQNGTAPATWTVRSRDDVQGPYNEIYNKAKHVARAHVQGKRVVVKSGGPHEKGRTTNWGGGVLYMELVYMEALRGAPGIPELLGGWFESDGSLTYVVADCGDAIGAGQGGSPSRMSPAYAKRAAGAAVHTAKSLLLCFRSWASAGFLLDDFRVNQFTMHTHTGEIYLVDGPKALWNSQIGRWTHGVWNRSKHLQVNSKHACARDADCPWTNRQHSCRADAPPVTHHNATAPCEPGSRAAPESRGECRDGSCELLSEKTHVYDVANRPWLLPFIYHQAKDPTTKTFLRMLIRAANQTRPEDRPSFGELVQRINAFGRFDAETYAAVAEAEDDGGSLDAAAVASSSRHEPSPRQHTARSIQTEMLSRVLLAACALTARAGVMPKTTFADMHDGDEKEVAISTKDGKWYLTLSQETPRWHLTTELDATTSTALVDFSKSAKPDKPPVPLQATVRTASGGRVLIEWTDPSGTLNPDPAYPLNVWLSVGAWDKAKLAAAAKSV